MPKHKIHLVIRTRFYCIVWLISLNCMLDVFPLPALYFYLWIKLLPAMQNKNVSFIPFIRLFIHSASSFLNVVIIKKVMKLQCWWLYTVLRYRGLKHWWGAGIAVFQYTAANFWQRDIAAENFSFAPKFPKNWFSAPYFVFLDEHSFDSKKSCLWV